jgi:hypothetical protein
LTKNSFGQKFLGTEAPFWAKFGQILAGFSQNIRSHRNSAKFALRHQKYLYENGNAIVLVSVNGTKLPPAKSMTNLPKQEIFLKAKNIT